MSCSEDDIINNDIIDIIDDGGENKVDGELQGWENPHDTPYSLNCN